MNLRLTRYLRKVPLSWMYAVRQNSVRAIYKVPGIYLCMHSSLKKEWSVPGRNLWSPYVKAETAAGLQKYSWILSVLNAIMVADGPGSTPNTAYEKNDYWSLAFTKAPPAYFGHCNTGPGHWKGWNDFPAWRWTCIPDGNSKLWVLWCRNLPDQPCR